MEIGTLNQRITLLEQRVKVDAIGNHCNQWEEAFSCWARATLKSSVENTDAGVTKEVQTFISGSNGNGCRPHLQTGFCFRGWSLTSRA